LIELRTKSVNTKELKEPLENLYVTYSLSPSEKIKKHDLKTPPLKSRLHAIKDLYQKGFKIGIHLDPIIYSEDFKEKYIDFLNELNQTIPIHKIEYISVGVVRFTKDVWYEVEKNYPKSNMHKQELVKSENGLVRYNRPMRLWMLNFVKDELLKYKIDSEKVYLCMED
jgi:spore photoproduct lyase